MKAKINVRTLETRTTKKINPEVVSLEEGKNNKSLTTEILANSIH